MLKEIYDRDLQRSQDSDVCFSNGFKFGYSEGYSGGYNDGYGSAFTGLAYRKPAKVQGITPQQKALATRIELDYAINRAFEGDAAGIYRLADKHVLQYYNGNDVVHSKEISIKDSILSLLSIYSRFTTIKSEVQIEGTQGDILAIDVDSTKPWIHFEFKNSTLQELKMKTPSDWFKATAYSNNVINKMTLNDLLNLELSYGGTVQTRWENLMEQAISNHKNIKREKNQQVISFGVYRIGLRCILYSEPIFDTTTTLPKPIKLIIE